jgi:hypothetical protein
MVKDGGNYWQTYCPVKVAEQAIFPAPFTYE